MPKKTPRPSEKKPTRRRPLKQTKIGGTTLSVQRLKSERFAVVIHRADRTRSKKEFATQAEAVTEYTLRCRETERLGVAAAAQVGDDERRACLDFLTTTSGWTPRPTVAEALKFFVGHKNALATSGTVQSVIDARLADARKAGVSKRHLSDLECRLEKFASAFGEKPLAAVTTDNLQDWLDGLGLSPVSQKNYRKVIHSVFERGVMKHLIEFNPAKGLRKIKAPDDEVGVITAKQFADLLSAVPERSRVAVAIMGLAGLRREECSKLEWGSVKLASRTIIVTAATAKTASRRTVPISDALAAWLQPVKQEAGPVCPTPQQFNTDIVAARVAAGISNWPSNALRHSCASAWVETESDVKLVAKWLGNSPSMIFKHYRAIVERVEAEAWIATFPPGTAPAKVATPKAAAKRATAKPRPRKPARGESAATGADETVTESNVIEFPAAS